MIILPAIDIQEGKPVRLRKGDFATAHQVAADALSAARAFERAGAKWLHMVDLDGAKAARPMNRDLFVQIAQETALQVELGGGIRDMQSISDYLDSGIARVILGSVALKNPALVKEAAAKYGERIAVGIDAMNGMVATEGWLEDSAVSYVALAEEMVKSGVKTIIFTDISRDGMLEGVNQQQLGTLAAAVDCRIIASGGVKDIQDVRACKKMGLYGVICGKSIYEGTLSLEDALAEARKC